MSKMLCVCIPTCNRQNMLKNLLISIINIIDNNKFNFEINIIVVDNDSNGSSFDCVKKLDKEYIYYFIEKTKGYSNVRNKCLKEAKSIGADYLIFIDDDEYPINNWIQKFYNKMLEGYDIIFGPVFPEFKNFNPPKWIIKNKFFIKKTDNYEKYPLMYTSNTFIKLKSINNLRFDKNFNKYGGEDVTFFKVLKNKTSCKFGWCDDAKVMEIIPEERTKIKWFLNRAYKGGISDVITDKSNNKIKQIFFKIIYNLIVGIILLPISIIGGKYTITKVLSKLFRSFGSIYALISIEYDFK